MSEPTQTCRLCWRQVTVEPTSRGFPPDIAKQKLQRWCASNGCRCDPVYQAGIIAGPKPSRQDARDE